MQRIQKRADIGSVRGVAANVLVSRVAVAYLGSGGTHRSGRLEEIYAIWRSVLVKIPN